MANDEMEMLGDEEQVLTPEDGFRLVVRLMRRYIDREQLILARLNRNTPYGYSTVRFQRNAEDSE